MSDQSQPLWVEEVADCLRVSTYTVREYIKRGHLKAYRNAGKGRLLIAPEALEAFKRESQETHVAYVAENVAYRSKPKPQRASSSHTKTQGPRYPQRRNADA